MKIDNDVRREMNADDVANAYNETDADKARKGGVWIGSCFGPVVSHEIHAFSTKREAYDWMVNDIRSAECLVDEMTTDTFADVDASGTEWEVRFLETEKHASDNGNGAKMREALEDVEKTLSYSSRLLYGIPPRLYKLLTRLRAALSEPPRNCDALSKAEVLAELDSRSFSKEDTIEWLYASERM